MSVTLISVSQDTVVSNKHEEQTRHYYVIFQHLGRHPWSHLHQSLELLECDWERYRKGALDRQSEHWSDCGVPLEGIMTLELLCYQHAWKWR